MISPEDGKGKARQLICQIRKIVFRRPKIADFSAKNEAIIPKNGENNFKIKPVDLTLTAATPTHTHEHFCIVFVAQ
jgi:hypothetical protein